MTKTELLAFYGKRANQLKAEVDSLTSSINLISNLRLASAIAFLITFYFALKSADLFFVLPLIVVAFFGLVQRHTKLFNERVHKKNRLIIQENEILGLNGNQNVFDDGRAFIDTHHPYSHDLDIFGEGSLFQFINRSKNISGKTSFAQVLRNPHLEKESIETRQEGIRELADKTDFRHKFQAFEREVDELPSDRNEIERWLKSASFISTSKATELLLIILPAITLISLALLFFVDGLFYLFLLCCVIQWGITAFYSKRVNAFHIYISNKKNILQKYSAMLQCMSEGDFKSKILSEYLEKTKSAHEEVSRVARLAGTFDARLNWMTFVVVNSTLLFDLQCVYRLEKWKEKNRNLLQIIDLIHETEVLCSLANFAFNNHDYVFPAVSSKGIITAESLGHPLIDREERVANDLKMDEVQSIVIITGANMAGKSTFLRTIGVNYLLACVGAPVCATSFQFGLMRMRSGMRTADSLRDHQSYFYAELNRLKSIIEDLKAGEKLFILLDEILKGTNSNDKQAGSIALVKQLKDFNCRTVIATHDLALGDLQREYPEKVRNFCFEPFIEQDQLRFDYLLKPGVATKMNATFLMKKMGIIPHG